MPRFADIRARLQNLGERATTEDLEDLAEEVASRCRQAAYPTKSAAAAMLHIKKVLPDESAHVLEGLVGRSLARVRNVETAEPPAMSPGFVGLGEAARRLGLSVQTLAGRLRYTAYRRLYGWPWWDRHQWHFSPQALDPACRASFLAALPEQEPEPQVAMLPEWCDAEGSR